MIEFAPAVTTAMPFNQAWLYCITLSHNGHKDWRLPTKTEYAAYRNKEILQYSFDEDDKRSSGDDTCRMGVCPVRTK